MAAIGVGFVITSAYGAMTVSAPKYYLLGSGSEYSYAEAPVNGQFLDYITWGTENDMGAVEGTYRCDVDITGGAGSNAALFGALYDSEWNLIKFLADKKAQADATDTLTLTQYVASNQKFKTFLWDSETDINPLTVEPEAPVILYFYCDDPNTVRIAWYNLGGTYTVWKNGAQVVNPSLTASHNGAYYGKHSAYVYTETGVTDGTTYVIKNSGTASETLTADFSTTSYAYVELGKYVKGRNLQYLRNDNAAWYTNSVSKHMVIDGYDCDQGVYKKLATGAEKWTSLYFKLDSDYIYGTGNYLDVTIDYYDGASATPKLYYYPDGASNTSNLNIATTTGSKSWNTVTKRISGTQFLANTNMESTYQLSIGTGTGNAVKKVTVTPVYDAGATGLTATATYADGIALSWSKSGTTAVEKYEVWRGGSKVDETTGTTYNDRGLTADTSYSYQIKPVYHGHYLTASNTLNTSTDGAHTITLPFNSGYTDATASSSSESTTDSEGTDYTQNGLTFRFLNNNRWRNTLTVARKRGNRYCRATVCTDQYDKGWTWADYRRWKDGDTATKMMFRVDNSVIPTTHRKLRFVFDYFDDSNVAGQSVEFKYLQYNNGGTPTIKTAASKTIGNTNTWKNWEITITDAQFSHNVNTGKDLNDGNGRMFDFQIGMGGKYGGFATDKVNVYILMPD